MEVRFYNFPKRANSTKLPNINPVLTVDALMRNDSSIIAPVLELHKTVGINTREMNYVYIPAYDRFYFVREWTWESGLWLISLAEDVLASWRESIGASEEYVVRSSAYSHGNINDTYYPFNGEVEVRKTEMYNLFPYTNIHTDGFYIMEIVGSTEISDAAYGHCYVMVTPAQYERIMRELMSDEFLNTIVPHASTENPSLKLQLNPLSYVMSVRWFPFDMPTDVDYEAAEDLMVGYGQLHREPLPEGETRPYADQWHVLTGDFLYTMLNRGGYPVTALYGSHSQSPQRGAYLNKSPYTDRAIFYPPFGILELDPDLLSESTGVVLDITVDLHTGIAQLNLWTMDVSGETITRKSLLAHTNALVGISVAVTQVLQPGYGILDRQVFGAQLLGTITGGLASIGANVATENLAGTVGAIGGTFASGYQTIITEAGKYMASKIPSVSTSGSDGSLNEFAGDPFFVSVYRKVVDDDPTHRGRPLCEKISHLRTLSAENDAYRSGYILVKDSDFQCAGTADEINAVRAFMEGGFYYE